MNRHRIGLLGGTFNPVHRGHIELGLRVREAFGLDRVLYILSARPPHKPIRSIPDAAVRFRHAGKGAEAPSRAGCRATWKSAAEQPSWTIDTILELKERFPGDLFYFITGSEGFLKIRTWKEYRNVLESVQFIIVLRRHDHGQKVERILKDEAVPVIHGTEPAAGLRPRICSNTRRRISRFHRPGSGRRIGLHQDVAGMVEIPKTSWR